VGDRVWAAAANKLQATALVLQLLGAARKMACMQSMLHLLPASLKGDPQPLALVCSLTVCPLLALP